MSWQDMPDPAKNEKRKNVENPELFMLHSVIVEVTDAAYIVLKSSKFSTLKPP